MMRAGEAGLEGIGVLQGDLLIIDVTAKPAPGCLVVVTVAGRFRVRRWERTSGMVRLTTGLTGPDFEYHHPREVDLYGVVSSITRKTWPLAKVWLHRRTPSESPTAHKFPMGTAWR